MPRIAVTESHVSFHYFEQAGSDITPIDLTTLNLLNEIDEIRSKCTINLPFEGKLALIRRTMGLINGGALEDEKFTKSLNMFVPMLTASIKDSRTVLVKSACLLISLLARELRSDFEFIGDYIKVLSSQLLNGTHFIADCCRFTIHLIVTYCPGRRILSSIIDISGAKGAPLRMTGCESLEIILNTWPSDFIDQNWARISPILMKMLQDSSAEVRALTRKICDQLVESMPKKACQFNARRHPPRAKASTKVENHPPLQVEEQLKQPDDKSKESTQASCQKRSLPSVPKQTAPARKSIRRPGISPRSHIPRRVEHDKDVVLEQQPISPKHIIDESHHEEEEIAEHFEEEEEEVFEDPENWLAYLEGILDNDREMLMKMFNRSLISSQDHLPILKLLQSVIHNDGAESSELCLPSIFANVQFPEFSRISKSILEMIRVGVEDDILIPALQPLILIPSISIPALEFQNQLLSEMSRLTMLKLSSLIVPALEHTIQQSKTKKAALACIIQLYVIIGKSIDQQFSALPREFHNLVHVHLSRLV